MIYVLCVCIMASCNLTLVPILKLYVNDVYVLGLRYLVFIPNICIPIIGICFIFLYILHNTENKRDIKHKHKRTIETRGNLEQSFARELLGNGLDKICHFFQA